LEVDRQIKEADVKGSCDAREHGKYGQTGRSLISLQELEDTSRPKCGLSQDFAGDESAVALIPLVDHEQGDANYTCNQCTNYIAASP
jgi:hypothetical protein